MAKKKPVNNFKDILERVKGVLYIFFTSNKAKTFYWQTVNGFMALLIGALGGIDLTQLNPTQVLVLSSILAGLNGLTKQLNKKYLTKNA